MSQPVDLDPTRNPNMPTDAPSPDPQVNVEVPPAAEPPFAENAAKRVDDQEKRKELLAQTVTLIQDNQLPMSAILGELAKRTGTKCVLLVQSPGEGLGVDIAGPATIGDAFSMVHLADVMLEERVRSPFREQARPLAAVKPQ